MNTGPHTGEPTSSEPSTQLSCPLHLRLAETQPPLAHTYSFREQEGATENTHIDTADE